MNLRQKLFLAATLLAVFGVGINLWTIDVSSEALRTTFGDGATILVNETMHTLENGVEGDLRYLQAFGHQVADASTLAASNAAFAAMDNRSAVLQERDAAWRRGEDAPFITAALNNPLADRLIEHQQFVAETAGLPVFGEVFVTNRYGAVVATTDLTTDYVQSDEMSWRTARQDGHYVQGTFDRSSDSYGFEIAVPLHHDGSFQGVLNAHLTIDDIGETLTHSAEDIDALAALHLLRGDGTVLYSTSHHVTGDDMSGHAFYPRLRDSDRGWVIAPADAGDGDTYYTQAAADSHDLFAGTDWVLVAEFEPDTVLAPIDTLQRNLTLVILGLIVVGVGIFIVLGRSILHPIRELTRISERISKGETDTQVPGRLTGRDDEIGALARSFSRLLTSLKMAVQRTAPELAAEKASVEEELAETHARQEATLEALPDGILVVNLEGAFTYYNERFTEIWDIPEDIVSAGDDEAALEHAMEQVVHPEEFRKKVEYLYEHPEEESFDIVPLEDGRLLERYSQPQVLDGDIVGRVWSFREMSGERGASGEQPSLEDMPIPLFDVAPDGTVQAVNPTAADRFGQSAEELVGRDIREFYTDPAVADDILDRVRAGETVEERVRLATAAGDITARLCAVPLEDDSEMVLFRAAVTNISDANGSPEADTDA